MNASQFMDKQILDLMNPQPQPQEEASTRHVNGDSPANKEEILASYDFQPIRTVGSSPPASTWGSLDSRLASSNLKSAGILEPQVLTEVTHKEERTVTPSYGTATVTEIDHTVKKYADNLLHVLEGVNARLSQLESRTHHMESSVNDLKVVVGNYTGTTDGRLRQFENILREVQSGVQILRDKQEITETQLHLSKLHLQPQAQAPAQSKSSSESTAPAPTPPATAPDSSLPVPLLPHQLQAPPAPPQAPVPQPPSLPAPNAPPPPQILYPPQSQNPSLPALPPPNVPQYPPQMPQSTAPSVPPYYPSQPQPVDPTHQQPYHQPSQSPPQQGLRGYQQSPPQPQAQAPPPSQYPPYSNNPTSQPQALPAPAPEEANLPYGSPPTQPYPPRGPAPPPYMQQPPPGGPLPPSSFYGPPPPHPQGTSMYNELPSSNRPGYGPPMDTYPYGGGSPSYRGGSGGMKTNSPFSSGGVGGGGKYENLPTAKVLPQAVPVGLGSGSGSGSGSGNRVPLDDVVEKVAMMGFSREQVRATVRKLTENGQNVDLNIVLDKLMNEGAGGDMIQPQKGWFNR